MTDDTSLGYFRVESGGDTGGDTLRSFGDAPRSYGDALCSFGDALCSLGDTLCSIAYLIYLNLIRMIFSQRINLVSRIQGLSL